MHCYVLYINVYKMYALYAVHNCYAIVCMKSDVLRYVRRTRVVRLNICYGFIPGTG